MFERTWNQRLLATVTVVSLFTSINAQAQKTPSDVFMQTQRAISEVELIRANKGVSNDAKTVGVQKKKRPLHVFGKCVEVIEKVVRLQKMEHVTPSVIPSIPLRKVTPAEVYGCTETVITGLHSVKNKLGVADTISEPATATKKKPSHVYRNMWQLSYLLDTLVGQISPNEVFKNVKSMQNELALIADTQSISLNTSATGVSNKTPKDVLLNCFSGLTVLKKVQRKMKVKPLKVPRVPSGEILPSDVYDCTNMQLTELHVIKVNLGIKEKRSRVETPTGQTPSDVFAQMDLYDNQIKQLLGRL